jgi:hypothetical protein
MRILKWLKRNDLNRCCKCGTINPAYGSAAVHIVVGITVQRNPVLAEAFVRNTSVTARSQNLTKAILTDVHFWIPVFVLLGGLAVLRWIS